MSNIVHCRICGGDINKKTMLAGDEYIMPAKNYYYHTKCYNNWKKEGGKANIGDDGYFNQLKLYLTKELKISVDFVKLTSQWNGFLKKSMTGKGIYFAVKYYYEVKNNSTDKCEGGIGIVPYIYAESCAYWADKEYREPGILAQIEAQILAKKSQKVVSIKKNDGGRPMKKIDWAAIEEEDEC